jgi:hypothetical protein
MKRIGILLALVMMGPVQAADQQFAKIADCMRTNYPPIMKANHFEIESTDRSGVMHKLEGKLYAIKEKNHLKVMLHITAPSNVAGASYLVIESGGNQEDDMYVFLPAINRVRHVTGSFANGSLLGTDFSYAEVKQIVNAFSGASGQVQGTEKLDGRDTHVLSIKPLPALKSPYTTVKAWVDTQNCTLMQAEFNSGTTIRKRLTSPADGIKQSGKYWYQSEVSMQDLRSGTQTIMRLSGVDSTKSISSTNFSPATFYLGQ